MYFFVQVINKAIKFVQEKKIHFPHFRASLTMFFSSILIGVFSVLSIASSSSVNDFHQNSSYPMEIAVKTTPIVRHFHRDAPVLASGTVNHVLEPIS
jgi:ABC-type nitrate/sulfonate/bicarbonate transport system permease component